STAARWVVVSVMVGVVLAVTVQDTAVDGAYGVLLMLFEGVVEHGGAIGVHGDEVQPVALGRVLHGLERLHRHRGDRGLGQSVHGVGVPRGDRLTILVGGG